MRYSRRARGLGPDGAEPALPRLAWELNAYVIGFLQSLWRLAAVEGEGREAVRDVLR
jgi:hypothetical protein